MAGKFFDRLLLIIGIACLGTYIVFTVQAKIYQHQLDESFDAMVRKEETVKPPSAEPRAKSPLVEAEPVFGEGDTVGRLAIPRLDVSVMVLEGVASKTLRLGAGHIPGTSIPGFGGNAGSPPHRDSFFRALSKIQPNDEITFQTLGKTVQYRVTSTDIVKPDDVEVLKPTTNETLTLVTCYPFYYIGPAPKRFIVKATVDSAPVSQ
jgi:sortase A